MPIPGCGEGAAGDGFASPRCVKLDFGGVTSDDAYKGSDPTDVAEAAPWSRLVKSLTPTNSAITQKWILCYAGIQRTNDVMNTMLLATDISPDKQTAILRSVQIFERILSF